MAVKLLVVDDEPDVELLMRQRLRKFIRSGDYEVEFARNGQEALVKLAQDDDIRLVLTDLNMPEMDGLALLHEINRLDRPLKTVVVSAYGDMENIRQAMNRGAFDFVTKPIDFEDLQITIGRTLQQLNTELEARQARMELDELQRELDVARRIQASILPRDFPDDENFAIFAHMTPARKVGGDFYDFFPITPVHWGFVVADVSGKGISSALFMAVSRTLLKGVALSGMSPSECLIYVNGLLYPDNDAAMFVTLFYGVISTETGEVTYCNAGHNAPLIRYASGETTFLTVAPNAAIGIREDGAYEEGKFTLGENDVLLLYTDGVTEAMNEASEVYGDDRLLETVRTLQTSNARTIIQRVVQDVHAFTDASTQTDDITLLAVCRK